MTRMKRWMGSAGALATILATSPAHASGTTAGTTITNTATVDFQVGGVSQTQVSGSDSFTVDRKVNLTTAEVGSTTTSVSPGQTSAVTTFLVAAAGFAIAAFAATPTWIIIGFMVANVGIYSTQAVFWTIPQSYLSRQSAPGAICLVSTIGSIGGAIIPIVIGRAKDASGSFTTGFLVVSGFLVLSAGLILIARANLVKSSNIQ